MLLAADPNAQAIGAFFGTLTQDLTVFALAMAGFFFTLAALFYMASGATGNERMRQHAISSLYAALAGLALALLGASIAALVSDAA
jgi:ABC-type transport system involved in multi-copper enzyme maturation permease subunit